MMPDTAAEWLTLILSALALGGVVRAALNSTATENAAKIVVLQKDQTEMQRRLQTVENELRHLPDKDVTHRLEMAIADLRNSVVKLEATGEQTARTAARVENFLLERGQK